MKNGKKKFKPFYLLVVIFSFLFFILNLSEVRAASLTQVSNLISTSAASTSSTHTIRFTATNAIPASGKIVITPEAGYFTIPSAFDYTDIDFAVATSGPFADRALAAVPSATEDGISVVDGTSGSISIILNSSENIPSSADIEIELGDNALFGETGDQFIINPTATTSYKINISTKDQFDSVIDSAAAMIAIVDQVTTGPAIVIEQAPVRINGLPSGEIAAGTQNIEISLNTNKAATCKYATTTDIVYSSMINAFSTAELNTLHTAMITGFQNNTSYAYYVRCIDSNYNVNSDDYAISFSIKPTPNPGAGGSSGAGGSGNISGGSTRLFRSSVVLEGWSYPLSSVTILKDGDIVSNVKAKSDGSFKDTVSQLERGTYTFSVYSTDSKQRKSATYSFTLSLGQGTNNRISQIVIPPTIELENDTVEIGDETVVFGESVSGNTIELFVNKQRATKFGIGEGQKFTATSTKGVSGVLDGLWNIAFNTSSFVEGTYEVKARTIISEQSESGFSRVLFLGIGGEPEPDFSLRADLNKDGKVNLVDFSILLVYWGTSDTNSDINSDGTVSLADFSIILFYWTG